MITVLRQPLQPHRWYVVFLSWAVLSGWILSGWGSMNALGYLALLPLLGLGIYAVKGSATEQCRSRWHFRRWRWRRILPWIYAVYAVLTLIGAMLYAPNNYDFLTYRFSRMLQWWSHGGWHWIATLSDRMNLSGVDSEFSLMPFFVTMKSDRLFFLVNWLFFLLLPGAVFVCGRELGLGRRLSWWLMWLIPCGYCYVLQAGSAGNDLGGSWLFLIALAWALRCRRKFNGRDFALSCMAGALMTGMKASNLPLLLPLSLPLAVALWRYFLSLQARLKWICSVRLVLLGVVLAPLSFFPIAVANQLETGIWTGDAINASKIRMTNPVAAVVGNSLQVITNTLMPPVFPMAQTWNTKVIIPLVWGPLRWLKNEYPRLELGSGELPTEEAAGIGMGIGCLTVFSLVAAGFVRRPMTLTKTGLTKGIFICGVVAFGVYLMKMGTESGPRLLSSYYPLLIMGAFAVRGGESLPRFQLWRLGAILASLSALPAVILTPSRPLIPVGTALTVAPRMGLPAASLERMARVYDVYQQRADVLAPIREALPPGTRTVGWLGGGDIPQIALWRPFGSRQVVEMIPGADGKLSPESPQIIVASPSVLEFLGINNLPEWQKANGLELLHEIILLPKASRSPEKFWVLQRSGIKS